jgi:hypothetical protein
LHLWDNEHHLSWKDLSYSLETGSSAFAKNYGKEWFDYLSLDAEKTHMYHKVISTYARRDYMTVIDKLDLNAHRSIVDIGGSTGTLLGLILDRFTHLQGELFDLPEVCQNITIPSCLASRLKIVPGNFFKPWPHLDSDAAILARVLHDWSDDKASEILSKIPCDTLYIIEILLDEQKGSGALLDLNMLVMTGGKERTKDEFEHLLHQSGFTLQSVSPLNEVSCLLTAKRTLLNDTALYAKLID